MSSLFIRHALFPKRYPIEISIMADNNRVTIVDANNTRNFFVCGIHLTTNEKRIIKHMKHCFFEKSDNDFIIYLRSKTNDAKYEIPIFISENRENQISQPLVEWDQLENMPFLQNIIYFMKKKNLSTLDTKISSVKTGFKVKVIRKI